MITKKIIIAASKGDVKAFKALFDFYVPRMRTVCRRYCQQDADVEDVLQEAFVKVYFNLKKYEFKGAFEGWIRRVVVYTAINHFKKQSPFTSLEYELPEQEDEQALEAVSLIEKSDQKELYEAIAQLPDGYKQVFNLYVLEEYPHKEIAELLGISEGTSRSQFSKAKKMLKKLLLRQRNTKEQTL